MLENFFSAERKDIVFNSLLLLRFSFFPVDVQKSTCRFKPLLFSLQSRLLAQNVLTKLPSVP